MNIPPFIRQRWDLMPDEQSARSFPVSLAALNARRIELACLLIVMNDILEMMVRPRVLGMWAEFAIAAVFIPLSLWARRWADSRAQMGLVVAFLAVGILNTEWTAYQLVEETGRIYSSYSTRILSVVLLFVLSPTQLAMMLATAFTTFSFMVTMTPVSGTDKAAAVASAAIISVVALAAGGLIHAGRRSDYEQKRLIVEQNEEMDHLMAITAHDLRSPLLGLRNLFDLATRRATKEPDLPLRVMRDGIGGLDSMLALINRLLDAHHAEHAPLAPQSSDDLRTSVSAAIRRIAPLAEASSITVTVHLPPSPLQTGFDDGALGQVLDNLLSNAVNHSPPESTVYVSATSSGDHAAVSIEDRGAGIDAATRLAMFDKFARGPRNGLAKPGTGMGLFIASTLAKRMGGELSYAPATPTGSIFTLILKGCGDALHSPLSGSASSSPLVDSERAARRGLSHKLADDVAPSDQTSRE